MQTYTEELDAVAAALAAPPYRAETDRIAAYTTQPEGDTDHGPGRVFALKFGTRYDRGAPDPIPATDRGPYGLGLDIRVPDAYDADAFDALVDAEWPDAEREPVLRDIRGLTDLGTALLDDLPDTLLGGDRVRGYRLPDRTDLHLTTPQDRYLTVAAPLGDPDAGLDAARTIAEALDAPAHDR